MQKAQRLVINTIPVFLIFSVNLMYCQVEDNAYYFADKIINLTLQPNQKNYSLTKNASVKAELFKHYYKYRKDNRPFYKTVVVDSLNGDISYDTLEIKENLVRWKKEYKYLDSIFSLSDIKNMIEKNKILVKWDSSNIVFNRKDVNIKWDEPYYGENYISTPYYNESKNHAFTVHGKKGHGTDIYIFRKEKGDWILIETIEKMGL